MIIIRKAKKQDTSAIIGFQLEMAKETENLTLDIPVLENGVKNVFNNPQYGSYYVATDNKEIIASLMITFEWSDWRNAQIWWIQSVYIMPEYRSRGVFRKMYNYIQKLADEDKNVKGIRLYVDKKNAHAQKVYKKIGMNGEHYKLFEWIK